MDDMKSMQLYLELQSTLKKYKKYNKLYLKNLVEKNKENVEKYYEQIVILRDKLKTLMNEINTTIIPDKNQQNIINNKQYIQKLSQTLDENTSELERIKNRALAMQKSEETSYLSQQAEYLKYIVLVILSLICVGLLIYSIISEESNEMIDRIILLSAGFALVYFYFF